MTGALNAEMGAAYGLDCATRLPTPAYWHLPFQCPIIFTSILSPDRIVG